MFFSTQECSLYQVTRHEFAGDPWFPAVNLKTAAPFNRCGYFLLALTTESPLSQQTVKEGDNYGDSSLQFVFRAQLISGEKERERDNSAMCRMTCRCYVSHGAGETAFQ